MDNPNRTDADTLALLPLAWTRRACSICGGMGKTIEEPTCPKCFGRGSEWTQVRWVPHVDVVNVIEPFGIGATNNPGSAVDHYATVEDAQAARDEQREEAGRHAG